MSEEEISHVHKQHPNKLVTIPNTTNRFATEETSSQSNNNPTVTQENQNNPEQNNNTHDPYDIPTSGTSLKPGIIHTADVHSNGVYYKNTSPSLKPRHLRIIPNAYMSKYIGGTETKTMGMSESEESSEEENNNSLTGENNNNNNNQDHQAISPHESISKMEENSNIYKSNNINHSQESYTIRMKRNNMSGLSYTPRGLMEGHEDPNKINTTDLKKLERRLKLVKMAGRLEEECPIESEDPSWEYKHKSRKKYKSKGSQRLIKKRRKHAIHKILTGENNNNNNNNNYKVKSLEETNNLIITLDNISYLVLRHVKNPEIFKKNNELLFKQLSLYGQEVTKLNEQNKKFKEKNIQIGKEAEILSKLNKKLKNKVMKLKTKLLIVKGDLKLAYSVAKINQSLADGTQKKLTKERKVYAERLKQYKSAMEKEEEKEEKKTFGTCIICLDNQNNTALNCGHVYCGICADRIKYCSLCKTKITNKLKIYSC